MELCFSPGRSLNSTLRTGVVEEKKSISFPIVKGILMETEDETRSSPTAKSSGFRSGRARETIFQSDETDLVDLLKRGSDLKVQPDCFGEASRTSVFGEDVEYNLAKKCDLGASCHAGLRPTLHGALDNIE